MNDIIKCENCTYMYECEYTYFGSCSNGVEWENEEKDEN